MAKFRKSNTAFVLYNLLAAGLLGLLMIWGVLWMLKSYTRHGVEKEVPQICGAYTAEAEILLQTQGLVLEITDSTYSKKVPLGTIVEQNPPAGAHVKQGRPIYVIVNAKQEKQVPVPALHDISYRQAEAMLRAIGLRVDEVLYEPSEYRDLVLDMRKNGCSVEPGTRMAEGTGLTLVVGQGKGTEQVYVPSVRGKTLQEAREALLGSRLVVGAVNYDEPDEAASTEETEEHPYIIYRQQPAGGQWILEGSHIDLYLSTDPAKAETADDNWDDEEDFF